MVEPIVIFNPHVAEQVGWYVYALTDPRDGCVFYIGKGIGNRVFAHAEDALDLADGPAGAKVERIRSIHGAGAHVLTSIIRHGLASEKAAYEVEAAVIDVLRLLERNLTAPPLFELTNQVLGHHHARRGLASTEVVASL